MIIVPTLDYMTLLQTREWRTWLYVAPLVCFNIVEFHQADRMKRHFRGEQPIPGDPINVNKFLTTTGQGEDVWWPTRLQERYDGFRAQFEEGHMISIQPTSNDRHLSGEDVLDDPRLSTFPDDVQPTPSQPRDVLHLPRDVPDCRRHASDVLPIWKGVGGTLEELQCLDESASEPAGRGWTLTLRRRQSMPDRRMLAIYPFTLGASYIV
ncbi:hypothetical protein Ahy_B04g072169 [Arachis hypogaea]|uniref:Aminotransferase-like plant mobile domain-containing protein n=1 Tax=Arachis hypogaea TaxID=3818 RepID=A0A444ZMJ3_ARAHY|nr:hypothetical protein Ahy_B04g072169 [Arachis hypogaea]